MVISVVIKIGQFDLFVETGFVFLWGGKGCTINFQGYKNGHTLGFFYIYFGLVLVINGWRESHHFIFYIYESSTQCLC